MLYKKYPLFDGKMEIMMPSNLRMITDEKITDEKLLRIGDIRLSQYAWVSADRKIAVSVIVGGSELVDSELAERMQYYYMKYKKDIQNFNCHSIRKRKINGSDYGQMIYSSEMMSYGFYNEFILGIFEGRELIMTLQCMENERENQAHIFSTIAASIKILSD